MHNKKIYITIISIIIFILGAIGIFVWGVNTLSQNEAFTTKIIKGQIHRLLDLDSSVEHPRAYLDWDLQYKIRANKLVFINKKQDLVSVEDLQLNVFVPYLLLRKIYITQMNGNNLYVDFERWENNKINILEIFNITGFFKIYMKNTSISVNHYFFKFTDKYHKPNEHMLITGNNILLSKFTLHKYFQLIMDGNIAYNKKSTPFSINYNAKIPNIKHDFNFEIHLPDLDLKVFQNYFREFIPDIDIAAKGSVNAKASGDEFFNFNANLRDIKFKTKRTIYSLDFPDSVAVASRFSFNKKAKDLTIDKLQLVGKDFDTTIHGKIFNVKKRPLKIDITTRIEKNSSANSIFKLLPRGIPVLHNVVDKTKDHNIDAIVHGELNLKGVIGQISAHGKVYANHVTLGYGYDLPSSSAVLNFNDNKMSMDAVYYPNHSKNEWARVVGTIKITKPFMLDLHSTISDNLDLVSGQRALNVYSDIFNFSTGPIPTMKIKSGRGKSDIWIKGGPPNVYLYGKSTFYNAVGSYPGFYGEFHDVSGEVDFVGKDIIYKNMRGTQQGAVGIINGKTELHKRGLSHIYVDIPSVTMEYTKHFITNSSALSQVSNAIRWIKNPVGTGSFHMVSVIDKDTKSPYVKGLVNVEDGSCDMEGLAYRATNIKGTVDFTSEQSNINFEGIVHNTYTKLSGFAKPTYTNLVITNPHVSVQDVYEFLYNSPIFDEMTKGLENFNNLSGTMKVITRISGDFSKQQIGFSTNVDIIEGAFKYLDVPNSITFNGGKVYITRDKILLENVKGTMFDAPYDLNGIVYNIGLPSQKQNLKFKIHDFDISNIQKLIGTKVFTPDMSKSLSEFLYKDGMIDIAGFVNEKGLQAKIKFNDAVVCYKKSGETLVAKTGELLVSENLLKMKNIIINMTDSSFIFNGDIKNYFVKPEFNLELTANMFEKDFNETIAPMLKLPMTLSGKIYTNIIFAGMLDDWHLKMRAMIDDASYVFYKGANLGEGLSKFMFFDIEGTTSDIVVNTLDVFSTNSVNTENKHDVLAEAYGKITNIDTKNPKLEDLRLKLNDYMSISFLNILFYDVQKATPILQSGKIKGNVILNGDMANLSIIGKAEVKDAVIPSIDTTLEEMTVDFNKYLISVKNALVDIAGSKAKVIAVFENKFTTPIVVKDLRLKSDSINSDKIISSFTGLFANDENPEDKKEKKKIVSNNLVYPPLMIQKGQVDIKEYIYNGLVIKNLKADFAVTPTWDCIVKNIAADVTQGKLRGEAGYNLRSTNLYGNIEAENIMANPIATSFLNLPNEFSGCMDANVKFTTKGKEHNKMVENLNASAYFRLNEGRMLRLGSVEYMLKVANTLKGGISRLNLNAVVNLVAPKTGYFDTIEGDLNIKNGVIYTDRITSKSNELNLFMAGKYNMNDSIVNATIIGQMPMESKDSILWLGPIGKISLKALVRQMTRQASRSVDAEEAFLKDPVAYVNDIPGLKNNKGEYRFFVISLKGNLYTDKYVDQFKWIK